MILKSTTYQYASDYKAAIEEHTKRVAEAIEKAGVIKPDSLSVPYDAHVYLSDPIHRHG